MPSAENAASWTAGAGIFDDARHRADRLLELRLQGAHVAAVGHQHVRLDQHARIGERRVLDPGRDQRLVGNDRLAAAERADQGVARADVGDPAFEGVDLDHVADAQAPLGEDDEAADVVGGDLLQPEAQADADRAAEEREGGEIDAHGRQREQEAEEEQQHADDVRGDLAQRQIVAAAGREQLLLDRRRHPESEDEDDAGGDGALEDVAQRHLRVADLPVDVVHRVEHHRRDAGDPENDRDPGEPRNAALDQAHPAHAGERATQDARTEADDASESRIGIASLNTAGLITVASATRAA